MKALLCILCPRGCRLRVDDSGGAIEVAGNQCARGLDFARKEITCPTRTLTTTVRTIFPEVPALPVRTEGEIPKGKIREVMAFLAGVVIREPVRIGEAAAELPGIGRIIVTSNILAGEADHG